MTNILGNQIHNLNHLEWKSLKGIMLIHNLLKARTECKEIIFSGSGHDYIHLFFYASLTFTEAF